jgi:hypothetical protein
MLGSYDLEDVAGSLDSVMNTNVQSGQIDILERCLGYGAWSLGHKEQIPMKIFTLFKVPQQA